MVKTCLKTFVEAFKDVKPKVHFILDHCGKEYLEMVAEVCPFEFTHEFSQYGNFASCLKQYNLAQTCNDDIFLFLEDDYLWKEGIGKYFIMAVRELHCVSPYDHPDFYNLEPFISRKEKIVLVNNWHWRTSQSNTMTFGITREKFLHYRKIFDYHGPNSSHLWAEIPEKMWCPIPSFATHFVKDKLAPSVDWSKYF